MQFHKLFRVLVLSGAAAGCASTTGATQDKSAQAKSGENKNGDDEWQQQQAPGSAKVHPGGAHGW